MLADPASVGEREDELLVEPAAVPEIDVLDAGVVLQLGAPQPVGELAALARADARTCQTALSGRTSTQECQRHSPSVGARIAPDAAGQRVRPPADGLRLGQDIDACGSGRSGNRS